MRDKGGFIVPGKKTRTQQQQQKQQQQQQQQQQQHNKNTQLLTPMEPRDEN